MLGKLLATPNHTKSRENTKLNSFLKDLLKISKTYEFSDLPQNVRLKCRSSFEDYVIEVGSKIGRLDFKISRFLSEKPYRNKRKTKLPREKWAFCPL
jgi:hypothetical protein